MITDLKRLDGWLITRVTITSPCHPGHIPFSAWQDSRNIPGELQHFLFYNNRPYLFLGSMNSLNVKVIHTEGRDWSYTPHWRAQRFWIMNQFVFLFSTPWPVCSQPVSQRKRNRQEWKTFLDPLHFYPLQVLWMIMKTEENLSPNLTIGPTDTSAYMVYGFSPSLASHQNLN